jgi:hypothetical protein
MATQQLLSTGIKINVDATDLDVKFAKSAEALNRTLTKSQKALGVFYNEQGLLVNSQGQVVEGLSQAQIKLGYYVDELGRTRTYQGGFTEGLNASQRAMGWFSDELGNVYDRMGELVIASERATKSLDGLNDELADGSSVSSEYETALQDMADGADQALGSLSQLAGQTSQLFATIQAATGENDAFTSSIIAASQGVTTFIETYGAVVGVMQYMDALRRATIAQEGATVAATVAQKGLNAAMKANPVGLIVGGVAALASAVATYKSTVKDAAAESSGAFAEIEAAARRAGDAIKSAADIARFTIGGAPKSYSDLESEFNRIQAAQAKNQAVVDAGPGWFERWFATSDEAGVDLAEMWERRDAAKAAQASLDALNERETEVGNALVDMRRQLLTKARESVQTESQKLEAERRNYEALLENAKGTEEEATIAAYIKQLDEKIAAAKESELAASRNPISEADYTLDSGALADAVASGRYTIEEAQAAYQGALDRQTQALESMGIADLMKELETVKTPLQQLDDMTTKLNAAYANGVIAQDKYAESLDAIAKKRADEQKKIDDAAKAAADEANAKTRSKHGIDDALSEIEAEVKAQKTPFELMNEAIAGYRTAMEKGAVDLATFDKLSKHEHDKYLKATKESTDAAEQERRSKIESLRSESGIDSLLESLKSPWQKYLDKLDKINEYVAGGAVTAAEAQLLADKALEETAGQNATSQLEAAKQRAEAKAKTVDTARAGSADVYKMQVAQSNDRAAKMLAAQQQLLASSQQMAVYMFRMQENIAAMAANWPKVYGR